MSAILKDSSLAGILLEPWRLKQRRMRRILVMASNSKSDLSRGLLNWGPARQPSEETFLGPILAPSPWFPFQIRGRGGGDSFHYQDTSIVVKRPTFSFRSLKTIIFIPKHGTVPLIVFFCFFFYLYIVSGQQKPVVARPERARSGSSWRELHGEVSRIVVFYSGDDGLDELEENQEVPEGFA